jgi:hypothetical protein
VKRDLGPSILKMRVFASLIAAVLILGSTVWSQTQPYADAGIGFNGLGYQSPYYDADVGVDWGDLGPIFVEAEVGADTANPKGLNSGVTVRTHGLVMWRATPHWRFGGGVHFAELLTSPFDNHATWPTLGAMFEQDWFRLNAQYLIPTGSDYTLNGPLFDMRMHLVKRFYLRERVGIYAYRDPNGVSPSHHVNAAVDFGILYVFH